MTTSEKKHTLSMVLAVSIWSGDMLCCSCCNMIMSSLRMRCKGGDFSWGLAVSTLWKIHPRSKYSPCCCCSGASALSASASEIGSGSEENNE